MIVRDTRHGRSSKGEADTVSDRLLCKLDVPINGSCADFRAMTAEVVFKGGLGSPFRWQGQLPCATGSDHARGVN
jgi:hypothetical protein